MLGDANKGGRLRWFSQDVLRLPIIESIDQVDELEVFADRIISLKKQNPTTDTSALEAQIDHLVYKLYDLTEDEIKIIEGVG